MKKLTFIVLLVLIGFSPLFCENYEEVKDIMESYIGHTNDYYDAVMAVETADQMAEVFLDYSRILQKDMMAMMSIESIYPELATMEEPPAELLPVAKRMEGLEVKMNEINSKVMQFINDPAMMEAISSFTQEIEMQMEDQ